jgi:hypothetical protein
LGGACTQCGINILDFEERRLKVVEEMTDLSLRKHLLKKGLFKPHNSSGG